MKTIIFDLDGTLIRFTPTFERIADIEQLKQLQQTFAFSIVTGCAKQVAFDVLEKTNLLSFFDADRIVTREDTVGDKSTGEPFRLARKKLSDHAVVIGDSDSDVQGSLIAGMSCVQVETHADIHDQRHAFANALDRAVAILKSL